MSNSNQVLMDYLNYNYYYSPPVNIHHSLSFFFPQYQSSFMPISTYPPQYPPQSPTFYNGYTPTYSPMEQYTSTLPPAGSYYHGPVEYVDEMAIILDSEDMFDPQTQMGHVNAGLSEKTISKNFKTSRYEAAYKAEEQEGEVCAVCQDEYKVKEMVGTLRCGHKYHANCIKQWLLLKNNCPICRATVSVV